MKLISELASRVRQSGMSKAGLIVYEGVKRKFMPRVVQLTTVYQLDEAAYRAGPPIRRTDGLVIARYDRFPDNLDEVLNGTTDELRAQIVSSMRREFPRGGVLWVGKIDGSVAAVRWSKYGSSLRKWYIPLNSDDVILFGAVTFEAYKGRGIHSTMIRHVIENEPQAGRFLCDIHNWNTISQRNWAKAGFRPILPDLPIQPALSVGD